MEELEDGHQLLKLEHGLPPVRAQHEAEGPHARVGRVRALRTALKNKAQCPISRMKGRIRERNFSDQNLRLQISLHEMWW